MPINNENLFDVRYQNWVMKVRIPPREGSHPVLFLIHGWTGDEDAMWIFASRLPKDFLMISLRGLYSSALGGYSWLPQKDDGWGNVDDFRPATDKLLDLLVDLEPNGSRRLEIGPSEVREALTRVDFSRVSLLGFSQGAALSYTFALLHPERVHLLGGLSGFLPDGSEALVSGRPLDGKEIFVTHGTKDAMVPIARARWTVDLLEQAGAQVAYCEDDVGHKLSAKCFNAMETYFYRQYQTSFK